MKPPDAIERVRMEDALKHLHECDGQQRTATVESLAGALAIDGAKAAHVLGRLAERRLATAGGSGFRLTEDGRLYARQVLRTHRLYETWLARETGVPATEWHRRAHEAEHRLPPADVDALADRLDHPHFDPHGDPIPTRDGYLPRDRRVPLTDWPDGSTAVVSHVEDEPEALFQQIEGLGLRPGMVVVPRRMEPAGFQVQVEGRTLPIAAELAGMIHLAPVSEEETCEPGLARLETLRPGDRGVIHSLSPACAGAERRRLLDLGLVPGTKVRCEFSSPFGWPMSYLIRGTMIALRREQAQRILLRNAQEPVPNLGAP